MHSLVSNESGANITVFTGGQMFVATSDHPNWKQIVNAVVVDSEDDPEVLEDLFDVEVALEKKFERLSTRLSVRNGIIYLDGDEIHNALSKQILRFLNEGVEDYKPLVAFFEKVLSNPDEHSREQLFEWLDRHEFSITPSGDIVGYKGVNRGTVDGVQFTSTRSGPAIVDGVEVNGYVANNIGSVIEMPRSQVVHNPSVGCSVGLHVGTYDYAKGFASAMLEVHVNPADVVSVPTDCDWQKVRCCRYTVVQELTDRYTSPLVGVGDEDIDDNCPHPDICEDEGCDDCCDDY